MHRRKLGKKNSLPLRKYVDMANRQIVEKFKQQTSVAKNGDVFESQMPRRVRRELVPKTRADSMGNIRCILWVCPLERKKVIH